MLERIIISGFGGQGVILLGKLIARIAAVATPHVTFFPSYGAEVRGGIAQCEVILSTDEIASPCAEQVDTLILMNGQDATAFMRRLAPEGLALINSSLCRALRLPQNNIKLIRAPASAIADQAGNPRTANLVMLGLLLQHKPLFTSQTAQAAMRDTLANGPADLLKINLKAFQAGLSFTCG